MFGCVTTCVTAVLYAITNTSQVVKSLLFAGISMRPSGLEPPRGNLPTRPSTSSSRVICVRRRPDRPIRPGCGRIGRIGRSDFCQRFVTARRSRMLRRWLSWQASRVRARPAELSGKHQSCYLSDLLFRSGEHASVFFRVSRRGCRDGGWAGDRVSISRVPQRSKSRHLRVRIATAPLAHRAPLTGA
jgi:hypothetical protein